MRFHYWIIILFVILLSSCATTPRPNNTGNACSMFRQYPSWKHYTTLTQRKYGVPIAVQMAIINQESSFLADARPPRETLLGFIPWKRPTTAFGYTQALNYTWQLYKRSTGRHWADRENFADAGDFIGWYASRTKSRAGIEPTDAYSLYLAYHEGITNYMHKSYYNKPWLIRVAKKVDARSETYHEQLVRCGMIKATLDPSSFQFQF
jgi:hypothetical protein